VGARQRDTRPCQKRLGFPEVPDWLEAPAVICEQFPLLPYVTDPTSCGSKSHPPDWWKKQRQAGPTTLAGLKPDRPERTG